MPGIFGIVDHLTARSSGGQDELQEIAERMAAAMRYEPSYVVDLRSNPALGAFVGRVGFGYSQDADRVNTGRSGITVLTTGEPLVRTSADVSGHQSECVGSGAIELLLEYERRGEGVLEIADGSFAGFLIDTRREKCLLFNDRYGMERIFLHSDGARTYFASEAKAILAVAPRTRSFDPRGLAEFLACGCTLGSRSLFRDIEVVGGGTVATFGQGGGNSRRVYFNRSTLENLEPVPQRQFIEGVSERLWSAVNGAVARPPAVGISLTGGLDSRMIMACLDAPAGTIPCYTFGSMYRETYDVSVGKQVAASCQQPHQVLQLDRQFLAGAQTTLDQSVYTSDGYIGFSGAAELYLNRLARSIAPVRMTGNWGGELLRGVRAFKYNIPKGRFLRPALMQELEASADVFAGARAAHPLTYTLFHHMPALGFGRYAVERSQVVMRAPFLANDLVQWLYRAPASARTSSDDTSAAVIRRRPELLSIPTDFGLLGTDSNAARSLRRWYRKGSFKAEYLASHGAPDWFAAFSASVPGGLIERPFLGLHKFQHFRGWFRSELAGVVRNALFDTNLGDLESWVDTGQVRLMVEDHIRGRANYTDEIDKLTTAALVCQSLLAPARNRPEVAVGRR